MRCSATGARSAGRQVGDRARARLRLGRGDAAGHAARHRDPGAKRPALRRGRRRAGRQRRPDLAQRRRLRPVQLLPPGLPHRRQARRARLLPAARRGRRRSRARRGQGQRVVVEDGRAVGLECIAGFPVSAAEELAPGGRRSGRATLAGAGEDRDQRRRRLRHARAAAALRARRRARRAPPARPPRRLDRRPLPRAGAWMGGRDAELLRRRVAGPGDPARGHVHSAVVRGPVAARRRRRVRRAGGALRRDRVDRRPPARPFRGPRLAHRRTAACGSATSSNARRHGRSSSGSRERPRSTSPPVRRRSTRTWAAAR